MRTNYKKIREALRDLDEARDDLLRLSRLNIGVISGGPSMADESAEFDRAAKHFVSLVRNAIGNGCRLSHLKAVCAGEIVVRDIIRDAIFDAGGVA